MKQLVATLLFSIIMIMVPLISPADENPIVLGASISLEGRHAETSAMIQKGYALWVDQTNKKGGLLGRPVKLVLYDDKSRTDLVTAIYEKLILVDKVDLVLSPYGSPMTMEAALVTEKYGYPMLACAAASENVWDQGHRYIFGIYALADRYFIGFQDMLSRQGFHRLGLVYEQSVFHESIAHGVRKWADRLGMNIVFDQGFSIAEPVFESLVENLNSTALDGFIFSGYSPECYAFIDLMKQKKIKPNATAFVIVPIHPDFYKKVGDFSENIFSPSQWEPDERLPFPGTHQFVDAFKSRYKTLPSYHSASAFSACQILKMAVNKIQGLDREKIRNYISSLDTVTIMGRFKVDHTGRQVGHTPILIQWQHAKKQIVYPSKMATSPPVFNNSGI